MAASTAAHFAELHDQAALLHLLDRHKLLSEALCNRP